MSESEQCWAENRTTSNEGHLKEQIAPFLLGSVTPPLSDEHVTSITNAGASAPYRNWGTNWPYFVRPRLDLAERFR